MWKRNRLVGGGPKLQTAIARALETLFGGGEWEQRGSDCGRRGDCPPYGSWRGWKNPSDVQLSVQGGGNSCREELGSEPSKNESSRNSRAPPGPSLKPDFDAGGSNDDHARSRSRRIEGRSRKKSRNVGSRARPSVSAPNLEKAYGIRPA